MRPMSSLDVARALAFTVRHAFCISTPDQSGKVMVSCRCQRWGQITQAFNAVAHEQAKDSWMDHCEREREKEERG